jgi:beta-mannosidase
MRTSHALLGALLLVACGPPPQPARVTVPVIGPWTFQRVGDTVQWPATVPGTVHTDLLAQGQIPDPYIGTNIDLVQWVGEADWTYRTTIDVAPHLMDQAHIDLCFEGLDTFAEVWVNGAKVGEADNMHRSWAFPIKALLRDGRADVEVRFTSALKAGARAMDAYGRTLPADNDRGEVPVSPFVRKAGVHFGWDFAPRLVTCGIWRPVSLIVWDQVRLSRFRVLQQVDDGVRTLTFHPETVGDSTAVTETRVFINDHAMGAAVGLGPVTVQIPDTGLWWPAGMGEPRLQQVRMELMKGRDHLDAHTARIGLRTIELHQAPDSIGTPFTFVVNGRPLFVQGANIVPPDMFLPRAGDAGWRGLVDHARNAHMNMLRVWGGGVYPPDAFFDACDEAGILVWQDLMFANTMVPDGDAFLSNVEAEVRQQVARLQHRASLALWCGNNEVDVAWHNWGWQGTWRIGPVDSARMWNAYVDLFQRRMPRWIAALDDRAYVSTSPLSNWGDPAGLRHGDLHYWGVWHGDAPFERFADNVGRFVSEYGMQSYPMWATLAEAAGPLDLDTDTAFWRLRQLSYKGDAAIERLAERYLGPVRGRRDLVEKSHALQAMAYALAIDAHVGARPHCMGTLLWQLNDLWPGASWSIVDHAGRRKPAYDAVRSAYARALSVR